MNTIVHPLKRKKPGRKKGPPTGTITVRVSEAHKKDFDAKVPADQRRPWMEQKIDETTAARCKGGRPRSNPERKP